METLALLQNERPKIVEISCGSGRDAVVLAEKAESYIGIDIAEELIRFAQEKVPKGVFVVADVETYVFPEGLDMVFAFASLIHTPKERLREVFSRVYQALNPGGVFRLSIKYSDPASEVTKTDEFGTRTYYLYSQEDVAELAKGFAIRKNVIESFAHQEWLEVLLQKNGWV